MERTGCPKKEHAEPEIFLRVTRDGNVTVIGGGADGLRWLAGHLAQLADMTPGSHLHLDENNGLEEDSSQLIIERL